MDDSIWTLLYSVADTWVATTHQTNLMNQNKGINSHFFLQYSSSRRWGMICCCGSFFFNFFYKPSRYYYSWLSFFFFSRSIERATWIQLDSRYLSKRVPTSLFPFKRGQFDVWMVGFCFGTINLLGFLYQGWEWGLGIGSPCTFWFIVVVSMWNTPVSMSHAYVGL